MYNKFEDIEKIENFNKESTPTCVSKELESSNKLSISKQNSNSNYASPNSKSINLRKNSSIHNNNNDLYSSPEVINYKKFSINSDFWSLNVVFYEILTGYLPFFANSYEEIIEKIIEGKYNKENLERFSDNIKNYFEDAFNPELKKRLGYNNIKDIKEHSVFKEIKWDYIHGSDNNINKQKKDESTKEEKS